MSDESEKTHRFRLYVDYPPGLARMVGGTTTSSNGHTFLSLIDEKGQERILGYYASVYALGPENVPEADRIDGFKDGFKKVSGFVRSDAHRMWHDFAEYRITREQYERIDAFVQKSVEEPPRYSLFTNNCTTWAMKAAEAGGLRAPLQWLGIATPVATAGSIAAGHLWDRLGERIRSAGDTIRERFAGASDEATGAVRGRQPVLAAG